MSATEASATLATGGIADLVDRLNCKVAMGPKDANGVPEFGWRDLSGTALNVNLPLPIMREAATVIAALATEVATLRQAMNNNRLARQYGDMQAELNKLSQLAQAYGWDGVNNSKILLEFLRGELDELVELRQQVKPLAVGDEVRMKWQGPGEKIGVIDYLAPAGKAYIREPNDRVTQVKLEDLRRP